MIERQHNGDTQSIHHMLGALDMALSLCVSAGKKRKSKEAADSA